METDLAIGFRLVKDIILDQLRRDQADAVDEMVEHVGNSPQDAVRAKHRCQLIREYITFVKAIEYPHTD